MKLTTLYFEFEQNYMRQRLRESTQRGYYTNAQHFLGYLGDLEVNEITPQTLDALTEILQQTHLSNKSVIYVHATLRRMLNYALKREYIDRNPYHSFDMPRAERYQPLILDETQIKMMLLEVKNTLLEVPVTLALCYGLRRGEILGIIPAYDLNVKHNILHIQRSRGRENGKTVVTDCKTTNSNRYLLLRPEHTFMILKNNKPGQPYLWPFSPSVLDTTFKAFLLKNDFPNIRFHDLRHSFATYMFEKGVNPKIISDILGHSSVQITLDLYSHPDIQQQIKALGVWEQ